MGKFTRCNIILVERLGMFSGDVPDLGGINSRRGLLYHPVVEEGLLIEAVLSQATVLPMVLEVGPS